MQLLTTMFCLEIHFHFLNKIAPQLLTTMYCLDIHFHFLNKNLPQLLTTMLPRFTFPSPLLCVSFILLSSSHGSNQPDQPKLPNDPNDQPRMSNDQPRVSNDQPKTFYIGGVLSSETTAHAFTMEAQVTIMTIIIIHSFIHDLHHHHHNHHYLCCDDNPLSHHP